MNSKSMKLSYRGGANIDPTGVSINAGADARAFEGDADAGFTVFWYKFDSGKGGQALVIGARYHLEEGK